MSFNTNAPFNAAIRSAGNRSRVLPDIGQGSMSPPSIPMVGGMTPSGGSAAPMAPTTGSPMQAPPVQPSTFTMHPPGTPADPNQYNYEPQPDGSWRVYPPGITAPAHTVSASLPRAASTGDYIRLAKAFQMGAPQPQQSVQSMPAPQQTY